jgi:hypothetical protein
MFGWHWHTFKMPQHSVSAVRLVTRPQPGQLVGRASCKVGQNNTNPTSVSHSTRSGKRLCRAVFHKHLQQPDAVNDCGTTSSVAGQRCDIAVQVEGFGYWSAATRHLSAVSALRPWAVAIVVVGGACSKRNTHASFRFNGVASIVLVSAAIAHPLSLKLDMVSAGGHQATRMAGVRQYGCLGGARKVR